MRTLVSQMARHRNTDANIVKRHMEIIVNIRGDLKVFIGQHRFVFETIFSFQMKTAIAKSEIFFSSINR